MNDDMVVSQRGLELIKEFEEYRTEAYPDPGTGGAPWTIGYGHTGNVKPGDVCDELQANYWLEQDVGVAEEAIKRHVTVPLTQSQFDALASFIYNVGVKNFASSTLLRKLNAGDCLGAANEFSRWNHAGGKILRGLSIRRGKEANLFMESL